MNMQDKVQPSENYQQTMFSETHKFPSKLTEMIVDIEVMKRDILSLNRLGETIGKAVEKSMEFQNQLANIITKHDERISDFDENQKMLETRTEKLEISDTKTQKIKWIGIGALGLLVLVVNIPGFSFSGLIGKIPLLFGIGT